MTVLWATYQLLTEYVGDSMRGVPANITYLHQSTNEGVTVETDWLGLGITRTAWARGSTPMTFPADGYMNCAASSRIELKVHFDRPIILKERNVGDLDVTGGGERVGFHVPPANCSPNDANTNVNSVISEGGPLYAAGPFGIRGPVIRAVSEDKGGWFTYGDGWTYRPPLSGAVGNPPVERMTGHTLQWMYGHPAGIGTGHASIRFDLPEYRRAFCDCYNGRGVPVWRDFVTKQVVDNPDIIDIEEAHYANEAV